jgi:hypothetical protein
MLYLVVQLLDWSAGHRAVATRAIKQTKAKFWGRCHCIDPELVLHIRRQILIQEMLHCFEQLHSVLFHDDLVCTLADLDVPLMTLRGTPRFLPSLFVSQPYGMKLPLNVPLETFTWNS